MAQERQITILNVDDSTIGRYAITRTLQQAGFQVWEAGTGSQTLRLAVENPDLIILDVNLPDMSGFEVCRQIKANPDTRSIPVLHLSAQYVTSDYKVQGLEGGADAYLVQPVEPLELVATIKALLRMRQAEERAIATGRDWQKTFDAISDGVCLVDAEGRVLQCNKAMVELIETPKIEIEGRLYHELVEERLGCTEGFPLLWEKTQANGNPSTARHKENRCRESVELVLGEKWFRVTVDPIVDEKGVFVSAVYIMADITQRIQAQEDLRQREAQQLADMTRLHELSTRLSTTLELQTILQEVLVAVTSLQNAALGDLRLYDPEKRDLYAVSSIGFTDEYLNLVGRVPIGAGACGTAIAQRRRIIIEDVQTEPIYAPYLEAAQFAGYRAVFSTPLFTRNGDALGTIAVYFKAPHQPSEREIYLVELYAQHAVAAIYNARLYQEAQNANRLKDEFLATLSHELRSPLNAMLGWTQLLRVKKFDSATTQRALETIERNAKSQTQLIEDLLDVSRIIRGQLRLNFRPCELVSAILAAIDAVKPAADAKNIKIETFLDSKAGRVSGDSERLQQVVWNLLTNAIKFTRSGGRVEVRLERYSYVQIQVRDTGKGISRDFLPFVFERFRQADSSTTRTYTGLGLGLAIVRHLVELHGGTVHAESPGEGLGATFSVHLPLLESDRGERSCVKGESTLDTSGLYPLQSVQFALQNPSLEGLRVLVVDDEPDAREVISTMVNGYGAEVKTVASAGEALAMFREPLSGWRPDVLVSDIGMPEEDGYALIGQVRALDAARGVSTPALALTAYARAEDRIRALSAGFQLHVPKPVNPDELAAAIANLAGRNRQA